MAWFQFSAGRIWTSFRRPAATTTISNAVILGASALTGVVTARTLGPSGRGQLTLVLLWSGLIFTVGSLGLPTSGSYHLARWRDRQVALLAWLSRVAARQAIVVTVISAAFFSWLYVRFHLPLLLVLEYTTRAAAGTITLYGAAYAQGSGNFTRFNGIRLTSGAVPAVLMIACALVVRLTTVEAGAAYLLPTWCSAVVTSIWLRRATRGSTGDGLSQRDVRSVWSYGWRNLTSSSSLVLNNSSDQFVLGLLVPTSSLGVYSVASAASSPLTAIIASLGMVGLPTVAQLTGQAKAAATWKVLRHAACFLAVTAPPLAVLLPWAIPRVYGAEYSSAVAPGELLLLGAAFAALSSVTDDLLRAHGRPGFVTFTQGTGGVVTVIGTMLLAGRSLTAVSIVSALGFAVAFVLAFARLWTATRQLRADGSVPVAIPSPTVTT